MYVGGRLSNIGTDKSQLAKGDLNGLITVFFESFYIQKQWQRLLESATGNYNLNDYYKYKENSSIKKKKMQKGGSMLNANDSNSDDDLKMGEDFGSTNKSKFD